MSQLCSAQTLQSITPSHGAKSQRQECQSWHATNSSPLLADLMPVSSRLCCSCRSWVTVLSFDSSLATTASVSAVFCTNIAERYAYTQNTYSIQRCRHWHAMSTSPLMCNSMLASNRLCCSCKSALTVLSFDSSLATTASFLAVFCTTLQNSAFCYQAEQSVILRLCCSCSSVVTVFSFDSSLATSARVWVSSAKALQGDRVCEWAET